MNNYQRTNRILIGFVATMLVLACLTGLLASVLVH